MLSLGSSTGDTLSPSTRLGVDAHDRPLAAKVPKRKGGSGFSTPGPFCGIQLVDCALVRTSEGRVSGRLRLMIVSVGEKRDNIDCNLLGRLKESRRLGEWRLQELLRVF